MHPLRVAVVLLAFTLTQAGAQPAKKIPRIGIADATPADCAMSSRVEAFLAALAERKYVVDKSITVIRKCYATNDEHQKAIAEILAQRVDVLVVVSPAGAIMARNATREIPIVCASCGDPLDNGLVMSLSKPGGNVTGFASLSAELIGKRLGILKEAAPRASRIAALTRPASDNPGTPATIKALQQAGHALGLEVLPFDFRNADELAHAFNNAVRAGCGAVIVQDDPLTFALRSEIAQLGLKHRLPISAGILDVAEAGALIGYGPNRNDLWRRSAGYVERILKGTKPANLPFEQPTKFDFVVNLKTAKAIGLKIPQSVLGRADRVIE